MSAVPPGLGGALRHLRVFVRQILRGGGVFLNNCRGGRKRLYRAWLRGIAFAIPVDFAETFALGKLSCHRALQCLTDRRGGQHMVTKIWPIRIRLAPPDRPMIIVQAHHGFATDLEQYFASAQGVEKRGTQDGIGKALRHTVPVNQEIGQSCAGRRPRDGVIVVDEQTDQTVHRVLHLLLRFPDRG